MRSARRLQLRKADDLAACRALAAGGQIRRLGKRWTPRPPVRCAGLTGAGKRCARVAAYGRTCCTPHEPEADPASPRRGRPSASVGNIKILKRPWTSVLIDELVAERRGRHDDQIDAAAGAVNQLTLAPRYTTAAW